MAAGPTLATGQASELRICDCHQQLLLASTDRTLGAAENRPSRGSRGGSLSAPLAKKGTERCYPAAGAVNGAFEQR
jgi:hypothetical protein